MADRTTNDDRKRCVGRYLSRIITILALAAAGIAYLLFGPA